MSQDAPQKRAKFNSAPIGLRTVLDSAPDPIFSCDAEGRWTWLNPAIQNVTGFKPSDLLGTPCTAMIAKEDRPAFLHAFLRAKRKGQDAVVRQIVRVTSATGETVALDAHVRVVLDESAEIVFVGVARIAAEQVIEPAYVTRPVSIVDDTPRALRLEPEPEEIDGTAVRALFASGAPATESPDPPPDHGEHMRFAPPELVRSRLE